MTCIVGLVDKGTVYIGGDSSGVAGGQYLTTRADEKVFRNGQYLIGFTSSFRMGQLLRYSFSPPKPPDNTKKLFEFMVNEFVPSIRQCFKTGGFTQLANAQEKGGRFLIGVHGRLFLLDQDFHIGESRDNYMAIGNGFSIAEGALFATKDKAPKTRVKLALEAATKHCAQVIEPFVIKSAKGVKND